MKKEPLIESSMAFVSSCSGIVIVDSRTNSGKIILPAASTLAGRSIIFKDGYNSFANNSLTLSTTGIDTFENDTKSLTVNTNNGFVQLISGSNKWYTVGTSVAGSGIQSLDLVSTVSGLGSSGYLSSIGSIKTNTIQLTYNQISAQVYDGSLGLVNGLAYGNGIWVAATSNSISRYRLDTSVNGFDWSAQFGEDIGYPTMQTVRYLNSTFFAGAVGDSQTPNNSTILTSVNGSNWIAGTTPSADIYDFGYSSFYLACGTTFSTFGEGPEGGIYSLFKSYNSSNWLQQQSTNMTVGYGLTYASSIWVMVGSTINNNGIERSLDGCNWSVIANSNIYVPSISNVNNSTFGYVNYIGNKVAYNSSIWVTTGNLVLSNTADVEDVLPYNFPVLVSYDANTWFAPSSLLISENVYNEGTSVLWSGSNWIVGLSNGSNATTLSSIITSPDGLDWTYQTISVPPALVTSMAKSDSLYIVGLEMGVNDTTLQYSFNGFDWLHEFTISSINSTIITSQSNALVINGSTLSYTDNIIDSKLDNLGTLGYVSTSFLTSEFDGLGTYGYLSSLELVTENFCVAGTSNGNVKLSYDGLKWSSTIIINNLTAVNAIAWNGSYWIAVGSGTPSTIALSADGYNWRHASTNALDVEAKGVAWNGSYWVAAGSGSGSVTMAVSVDGFNWLAASNSLFVGGNADTGLDVAWNGTYWVAVGISAGNSNTIILSSDGYNWSTVFQIPQVGFYANSIAWNGSYWLATAIDPSGTRPLLRSYDSYNWSYLNPLGNPSVGYDVAWNGISWMAVGLYNSSIPVVSLSSDENNWTSSINCPLIPRSVTWNGSYWVVTGSEIGGDQQTIALTRDGSNWQTPSSNPFPTQTVTVASRRVLPYVGLNITGGGGGGGGGVTDIQITSTVTGLGTLGYVSSMDATISTINGSKAKYTTENMCVAIDNGNNPIVVSLDGINWTSSLNNPFYGQPWNVAWNGAYWLAVGNYHTALSADGYNWTSSINDPANGGLIMGLAWNGSYWAAVATTGTIISSDGYNWTSSINDPFSGSYGRDIAWNGSYWVAVGGSNGTNTIAVSSDGYNWTSSLNNPFNESSGFGIAWNGSYWVAVGDSPTTKIAVSTDGYNWTSSINDPFDAGWGYDIAWNGLYWVVVGGQSGCNVSAAVSTDGYNWTSSINNPFSGGFGRNITWNGVYWIASGDSGATVLAVSRDGYNWNSLSNTYGGYGNAGYGIASRRVLPYVGFNDTSYASKNYVNSSIIGLASSIVGLKPITESMCIALSQNANIIAVTYDGYNWTSSINHTCTLPTAVAWNGAYWIVVGESIVLSSDGYNWTSSINNPFSGNAGRGIAWNGSYWVTVGSNVISVSTDGYNWSPSSNNPLSDVINAVAWNGSYWLAAGNGAISIAVSTDGYNWLAASNNTFGSGNGAFDISWNGSYWIAAGGGGSSPFSISTDGYNWLAASNNPFGATLGLGIQWNGSYWLGLGYLSNTIAVSKDGYNWTSSINDLHFDGTSYKAAWTGSQWIVVGSAPNSIVISKDGYNWTSSINNPFSGNGTAIASRRVLPYVGTQIIPNALTTLYNPLYPSIWASPQPSTIQSAIDRLAVLLSTFTTSNIP